MAVRGETIGTAYVRILANGDGLDDSIREEMRSHGDVWDEAGEDASDHFWKAYDKQHEKNAETSLDKTIKTFDKSMGRWATLGELSGSDFMDGVREALSEGLPGGIGDQIGKNLSDDLERGAISGTAGIRSRLANIAPEIAKATKQITDAQNAQWRAGYAETERISRLATRTMRATVQDQKRIFAELRQGVAETTAGLVADFRDLGVAIEGFDKSLFKSKTERRNLVESLVEIREAMPEAVANTHRFRAEFEKMGAVLTKNDATWRNFVTRLRNVNDGLGRTFGRGSRNDFLNFFGGFITVVPRAMTALTSGVQNAIGGIKQLGAEFRRLRDSGDSVVQALLTMASQGIPGLVATAVAAGIAIQTVTTVLPLLAAAVSLATGAVLALAGSLGFALVGALGAVAGAMVPFAAALGVGALAIAGLPDKSPALDNLKKTFEDLKKTAAAGVFGKDGAGLANLEPILKSLTPLVDGVSKAIGGLLTELGKVGQSKAFTDMMSGITAILPGLVTQLGGIGGKLALGIGQAFVALGPIIQEFLGWLDDIAGKFVDFGKGGKDSGLAKFFNDAWASAKIVGGLIGDIIDLIGELFSAGKGTGDQIFQDIAKQVQEIVKWLSSPDGQKALAKWFADAKLLAGQIGEAVKNVIEFVDAIDNDTSRNNLITILGWVNKIGDAIVWVAQQWSGFQDGAKAALGQIPGMASAVGTWIAGAATAVGTWVASTASAIAGAVSGWAAAVGNFFTVTIPGWLAGLQAWWGTFWTGLTTWVSNAMAALPGILANVGFLILQTFVGVLVYLATFPQRVAFFFLDVGPKIIAAMGNVSALFQAWLSTLPGKAKAAADAIVKWFAGLGAKIIAGAGNLASQFSNWISSLPGKAKTLASNIISALAGLAGKIIKGAGNLASQFASWVKDIPGKAKDAAGKVVDAFKGVARKIVSAIGSIPSAFSSFISSVKSAAGKARDALVAAFKGTAAAIVRAIGTVVPNWALPKALRKAAGGIVSAPVVSWIGEEGPEAIIPLNRNLSRVDPAVRALSAIAQGLPIPAGSELPPGLPTGGGGGMNVTIVTPTEDPRAVAAEVFARFTAASYV